MVVVTLGGSEGEGKPESSLPRTGSRVVFGKTRKVSPRAHNRRTMGSVEGEVSPRAHNRVWGQGEVGPRAHNRMMVGSGEGEVRPRAHDRVGVR